MPAPNFKTSDWQWFLQDIETQLEQHMKPDTNEVERYQAELKSHRTFSGTGASSSPPVASVDSPDKETQSKLLPSKAKAGGSYGTFFDVGRTGSVNGKDDDEMEMPVFAKGCSAGGTKKGS